MSCCGDGDYGLVNVCVLRGNDDGNGGGLKLGIFDEIKSKLKMFK
jgi:hypothetical protein